MQIVGRQLKAKIEQKFVEEKISQNDARVETKLAHYQERAIFRANKQYAKNFSNKWQINSLRAQKYNYFFAGVYERALRVMECLRVYLEREELPDFDYITDLGCGYGGISAQLKCLLNAKCLQVMDINRDAIEFQKTVFDELNWRGDVNVELSSFQKWQSKNQLTDLLVSYGAFEFFYKHKDIKHIFSQVSQALKTDGIFIAHVRNHHFPVCGYSSVKYAQYIPFNPLKNFILKMNKSEYAPDFRSLSFSGWSRELQAVNMSKPMIYACQIINKKPRIILIDKQNMKKFTHVFIVSKKC